MEAEGILRRVISDPTERKYHFEVVQDVEPILEHNKMLRGIEQKSDWGRHIATIPVVILNRWFNEEYERGNVTLRMGGAEWEGIVARKLADPDWAFLRTDK